MKKEEENEIFQKIGNNIKNARILNGFTQEYLAEKLNKSTNFISLIERGQTGIGIKTLIDICKILEIDPNYIFNGIIEYNTVNSDLTDFSKKDKEIISHLIDYIKSRKNMK